ncbi:MAG: hypothetical protein FJ276_30315 [Planctomycetes bacterium]|nr:hypothetical protein [Planctomycetota bacterium]
MNTPQLTKLTSITGLVEDLDESTLRGGHALLDRRRAQAFSQWMDVQLEHLEERFSAFVTVRSIRRSLGR